jgi:hypothetical protein
MITLEMLSFEAGLLFRHAEKLIQRVGPNTKIMRKAKMSFQSGQVKQVIRTYAVEIQTSDKKELDADQVTMKLRKAMGANCERIPCVL